MARRIQPVLGALALAAAVAILSPVAAEANGLRVSPVTLEVTAPGAATTLTLRNTERLPKTVQIRVFRWIQKNGQERFEATNDVMASPPMTELAPGAEQTVRIVRTSDAPVHGEEAYRLFVDEVPDRSRQQGGTVSFATRLRIPIFFIEPGVRLPQVAWSLRRRGDTAILEARNTGDVRLRVADVALLRGGSTAYRRDGLFGYVLGGASMQWQLGPASQIGAAGLKLQADTSQGLLNATVPAR